MTVTDPDGDSVTANAAAAVISTVKVSPTVSTMPEARKAAKIAAADGTVNAIAPPAPVFNICEFTSSDAVNGAVAAWVTVVGLVVHLLKYIGATSMIPDPPLETEGDNICFTANTFFIECEI